MNGHLFNKTTIGFRIALVLVFLMAIQTTSRARPVPGDVRIDIELMPSLTRAQTLSLATLGIDTRGAGARLMTLIIENRTERELSDLYLYVKVDVSGIGTVTQLDQRQGLPFSLRAGQVVTAGNNDLQHGLPGVPESIRMEGELTAAGEDFINSLEGSTILPDRIYTVELHIYHGNNRMMGGDPIAETSATLPIEEMFTDLGFDLISPGAELGMPFERITSNRPVFRWEGSATQTCRIIIVEAVEGQSAQNLIQSARNTRPVTGTSDPGELLEFEMADALVSGNSFSYPFTNVQPLQPGTHYYWQVFVQIETPSGTEWYPSPIWQYGIRRTDQRLTELDEEVLDMIEQFLPQRFLSILLEGYTVESAVIDGRTVSGAQLLMEFEQFLDDLENGRVRIVD